MVCSFISKCKKMFLIMYYVLNILGFVLIHNSSIELKKKNSLRTYSRLSQSKHYESFAVQSSRIRQTHTTK